MPKLYYAANWQQVGIQVFDVSDDAAAQRTLTLPGLVPSRVPRRNLHDTLEAACASVREGIDAQLATLEARVKALRELRAGYEGDTVAVATGGPPPTEVHRVDQGGVAKELAARSEAARTHGPGR